ncbi:MAG: EAL domain-containing protein [Lachnospiraceae bacterium]
MTDILFYQNYNPVADVCTIVFCIIFQIILRSSYTQKQKSLFLFASATGFISFAAFSDITYHILLDSMTSGNTFWIYFFRNGFYISLMLLFVIFCYYLGHTMDVNFSRRHMLQFFIWLGAVVGAVAEITAPWTHYGFYIDSELQIHQNYFTDPFRNVYIYYIFLILWIMISYRRKMISKMFWCIMKILLISVLVMTMQYQLMSTSYTCITFLFPMLAVLFLFHYNSYDVETGTLDSRAFGNYTRELNGKEFMMISLYLRDISVKRMKQLIEHFFHFNEQFFYKPCTFRMRDGKFVMLFRKDLNPDAEKKIPQMLEDFYELYQRFKIDYRLVIIYSDPRLVSGEDYMALDEFIEEKLPINSVAYSSKEDVDAFLQMKYVLEQLNDINEKGDLEDERVRVYCQPVLNTKTGVFSSAEVLMRLNLPKLGIVMPNLVIPLAEKHEMIHTISRIVLNKTCQNIRKLEEEGYELSRVSVNFSIMELKDVHFCDELLEIMDKNQVPYEKIAVELTESRNETDFEIMKQIMCRLQKHGIRFYLDDFGTGYSNFERIIELPVDIIKFDRSLTILSGRDANSRDLVGSFSDIFTRANYQVLFEGVETEDDEQRCENMNAQYLQGFKYSEPVPMMQLGRFLSKKG